MISAISDAVTAEGFEGLSPSQFRQSNDVKVRRDILNRQVVEFSEWRLRNFPKERTDNSTLRAASDTNEVSDELKVIALPRYEPLPGRPNQSFAALQEWEGVVTAVIDDLIHANLVDITAGDAVTDEVAEIPLSEVSQPDRSRVVPGAIFRWVIGYLRMASGTQINGSIIYFRRPSNLSAPAKIPPLVFETND